MFSRALVVITLAVAAVASPTGRSDVCSTGTVSCCNQIAPANQVPTNDVLAALLALNIQDLDIPVGIECTPLSVLGGASAVAVTRRTSGQSEPHGHARRCEPQEGPHTITSRRRSAGAHVRPGGKAPTVGAGGHADVTHRYPTGTHRKYLSTA